MVLHALVHGDRAARGVEGGLSGEYTGVFSLQIMSVLLTKAAMSVLSMTAGST